MPPGVDVLALRFDYQPRRSSDRQVNAALVEAALARHNERRRAELDPAKLEDQRQRIGAHALYRELHNLVNVVLIDPDGLWRGRWDRNPAILDGLRHGRAILSGGPILDLRLRSETGEEAMIGETPRTAGAAELRVTASRIEPDTELRVFRNGECVHTLARCGDGVHTFPGVADGPGGYRVEAWQNGRQRAITNHVERADVRP